MSVVVVGLDRRGAPPEVLESVPVGSDGLADALEMLLKSDWIAEAVILSTCMRTEVYVEAVRFHGAVADVRDVLARLSGLDVETLSDSLFELYDEAAHARLFRIAAGLESAVVGETEVLGQVARAWQAAADLGAAKSILSGLFRHAIETGKRARSETAIARGITSIGQAAVTMATQHIGGLADKDVLIVGAGDMGDAMAVALSCTDGVRKVKVVNRSRDRADELAARVGGEAIEFEDVDPAIASVDLVLSSTAATEPVITCDSVRAAMSQRSGRPLVIVDVAVPRDVEPGVAELPEVTVLGIDELREFAEAGHSERRNEVAHVRSIVDEEVSRYVSDVNGRLVAPVIKGMRERADFVREAVFAQYEGRIQALSPAERELIRL